jgi:hypothetical protein
MNTTVAMVRRLLCRITGGHEYDAFPRRMFILPLLRCHKCGDEKLPGQEVGI